MAVVMKKQPKQSKQEQPVPQDLIASVESLTEQINRLASDRDGLYQQIADQTCPYKVGQVIQTDQGLGKVGLKIHEVVFPPKPEHGNWWQLDCFALSKAGEVTKRYVSLMQKDAEAGMNVRVV